MANQIMMQGGYGYTAEFPNPIITTRAPVATDIVSPSGEPYQIGQLWNNSLNDNMYMYVGSGSWILISSSSGSIVGVNGTANEITVVTTSGIATISLPSAIVAPGSLTTTTTLTGGTGITATAGNITATAGNVVVSTAGDGLVLPVTTATGAASGTVNCNGRAGSVTFTGISIASDASQTVVVGNTSITGSGTVVLYFLRGVQQGTAITITSVSNTANTSTIVLTAATGGATQTGNITLDFIVLN